MSNTVMFKFISILFAFLAVTVSSVAFAETIRVGDIIIEEPWARASIGTSRPAAAYLTIRNIGSSDDVLTVIETRVSTMPEVHRTEMRDGVAVMVPVGPVEVPGNSSAKLEPGGLHIMLMKLQFPLVKGERFLLNLIFEKAGSIEIFVPIHDIGASGPED